MDSVLYLLVTAGVAIAGTLGSPKSGNGASSFHKECGGDYNILPGETMTFHSPRYSDNYQGGDCMWVFNAEVSNSFTIECINFNLGKNRLICNAPYVNLNGKRYCGAVDIKEVFNNSTLNFFVKTSRKSFSARSNAIGFQCSVTAASPMNTTEMRDDSDTDCYCNSTDRDTRIVGGDDAVIENFPYQASLRLNDAKVFCGASIISPDYILTAAHCGVAVDINEFKVYVGEHDISNNAPKISYTVEKIIIHEDFMKYTLDNDIALLKLTESINFTTTIQPVCLPYGKSADDLDGKNVTVTGWGVLATEGSQPDTLQSVIVQGLDWDTCSKSYIQSTITRNMVCAFSVGKDACQGDSGGPLVLEIDGILYQYGIVSFGIGCASKHPGVYTNVVNYLNWISEIIGRVC